MDKKLNFAETTFNNYGFGFRLYKTMNEFGEWTMEISIPPDRFDRFTKSTPMRIADGMDGLYKQLNKMFPAGDNNEPRNNSR